MGTAPGPARATASRSRTTPRGAGRRATVVRGLALGLLGLLSLAAPGCGSAPASQRIVLVTLDTLRSDAFADGDAGASRMPALAALARRGAIFTRAYAASNATQPTHASLFTGLHPWQHGVTRNGMALGGSARTVAERLREAGFATGAVVASFPLARRFGFAQGFDDYREVFSQELVPGLRRWEGAEIPGGAFYALAAAAADEALALLDSLGGERQFVWLHFFDAHDPYGDARGDRPVSHPELVQARRRGGAPFARLLGRARELYAADLAVLDAALARVLAGLERDGRRTETHVVVTADHGESFGEWGHVGHGESLGPQEVQVPLFVVSPRVAPGLRTDVAASIDVAATLLSLAGVAGAPGRGRDLSSPRVDAAPAAYGMSHAAELPEGSDPSAARFFAARPGGLFAGDAQRVARVDGGATEVPPALASSLRALFADFEASSRGAAATALDDAVTREALRALGYAE